MLQLNKLSLMKMPSATILCHPVFFLFVCFFYMFKIDTLTSLFLTCVTVRGILIDMPLTFNTGDIYCISTHFSLKVS